MNKDERLAAARRAMRKLELEFAHPAMQRALAQPIIVTEHYDVLALLPAVTVIRWHS